MQKNITPEFQRTIHTDLISIHFGIAAALKEPGVLDGLCGRIRLCAVPAKELLEIEYRSQMKAEGKIKYFGGENRIPSPRLLRRS